MLRITAKTITLAAALVAVTGLMAQTASAQELQMHEHEMVGDCQDGSCPAGAAGGVAGCGLYGQNCRPQYYGQPELFYNYYAPGTCGGVPANMYLAPQPVPAWVGHTYYTYQPMMPHELLYKHHRTYYRYYNGGRGMTRTSVSWCRPPLTGWNSSLRIAR
jgi:hypothetical protein